MVPARNHSFLAKLKGHYFRNGKRKDRGEEWKRAVFSARRLVEAAWILVLWWGERRVFGSAIEACQWERWEDWPEGAMPHRMVLIADPQLIDPHTYSRRGALLSATIFYTDQYMSRSYETIQERLVPSTTVFLGDLFDGGREWTHEQSSLYAQEHHLHEDLIPITEDPRGAKDWKDYDDSYWMGEYKRFLKIFPSWPYRRTVKTLPGNHDFGMGNGIKEGVKDRFRTYFGETSGVLEAGNHTIVLIDSVSLSNNNNPKIYMPARDFLDSLPDLLTSPPPLALLPHVIEEAASPLPSPPEQDSIVQNPTILLTHVPLYRPADTPCGPHRESKDPILIHGGYQYQNVLQPDLSSEILQKTNAKYVFSGDDHDYCEVEHAGNIKEVTVKSFSWAMGVRRPGFYMVSLYTGNASPDTQSVQGRLCLLPDQWGVFSAYIFMLVLTILAAVFEFRRSRRAAAGSRGNVLPISNGYGGGPAMSSAYGRSNGKSSNSNSNSNSWREDEDGDFKYSKRKQLATGWKAWVTYVLREVGLVAVVVLVWYAWLIWRW
ncbi:Metallo-dependent phosphatase [Choiromyces venosus 120613-1]|uniref:Metallo-dependent phosphatase n=1 Tax=Choiromyces venosus 120613-1 TaxID=1336337 RepID=A0A3N4IVU4_9PEZI|nr:Metallo-dependent phosphatase [Choiromyces venosus 120613-1]